MSNPAGPKDIELMATVAEALDTFLNGEPGVKNVAFVVLTANFNDVAGGVNYISNAARDSVLQMLREIVGRMEGRLDEGTGTKQ
jgi:hypothetical protein